jgi:hypothetical protein
MSDSTIWLVVILLSVGTICANVCALTAHLRIDQWRRIFGGDRGAE